MAANSPSSKKGKRAPTSAGRRGPQSLDNLIEEMIADDEKNSASQIILAEEKSEEDAPVVMLVHALLKEAIKRNASDIHIEPEEDSLRIRFRIDGSLQEVQRLPSKLTPIVVSRLKIMGELDITERRIPQDGCIRLRNPDGNDADFRLSTLPSVFGEKTVLRVMSSDSLNNDLEMVGLPVEQLKLLRSAIAKPDGLVLVTGPTGSGKTTTLYASISELNDPVKSIFTAEDPVEGTLKGTTQVQVNNAVGYNFATVLRSLLRQDPDIILVGEIRDKETIDIAIKASLTGHIVLSSLHTNDTAATVQRLLNMGVESYLIASALNLIVAQRLVRRICDDCKEEAPIDATILEKFSTNASELRNTTVYKGKGCDACSNTGYKGRVPVYEIMNINDRIADAIVKGASVTEIKRIARVHGMITLREAGIERIKEGLTTLEEVLAKTNADEDDEPTTQTIAQPSPPEATLGTIAQAAENAVVPNNPILPQNPAPIATQPITQTPTPVPTPSPPPTPTAAPPVREVLNNSTPSEGNEPNLSDEKLSSLKNLFNKTTSAAE